MMRPAVTDASLADRDAWNRGTARAGKRDRSQALAGLLPASGIALGAMLILGPLLAGVVRSLLVWHGDAVRVSLANFGGLLADPRFYSAVGNTLLCGVCTTLISLVLGTCMAWIVTRTDVPGRRVFETLNLVPFFMSPYVGALAWVFLVAPYSGLLQTSAQDLFGFSLTWLNVYSRPGVIWVLSLFYAPYVYLLVLSPLRQMDGSLEDAARVHGASFWSSLRLITLPLLYPAMLSSCLIIFVTSAGLFDVPLALTATKGIRMVPTEIFSAVSYPSDLGRASAYGILITIATVAITLVQRHYLSRRRYITVTGKGYRARRLRLSTAGRLIALVIELTYIGTSVVLPTIALLAVALSPLWTGRFDASAATLGNFHYVLFDYPLTQGAIRNSLVLALFGASIGVVLSTFQSYFLERSRSRFHGLADAVVTLPLGIPGIVLSLFFLTLAIRTPLYDTLTIMLIAYLARFFPLSTRTVTASLIGLHPELEESARACGASWLQTMRHIVIPLLRPALLAAWIMLFVVFIRELGASILLYTSGTETMSVAMVLLSENSAGYVAALALIQLAMLLGAFVILRLTRAQLA
jgi:iron(III) transport system permease protein